MSQCFFRTARSLAAVYLELYAAHHSIDGPLAPEHIHEARDIFTEMMMANGIKKMLDHEKKIPSLSHDELQAIILSELRAHNKTESRDALKFRAGLIVHGIQSPNTYSS